jgi:hypothetical protein
MRASTNFLTSARHSGEGGQKEGSRAEAGSQKENHMLSNVAELVPASKTGKRLSPDEVTKIEVERMRQWIADRISACQSEPVLESVTLTPVLAKLLLERNDENRPISEVNLDRIKRDIERNLWEFNGEPIIISKDGLLNDGQHRCRAVVETGQHIRMVIVFGPQRKSRLTLDQGTPRTTGHFLTMLGHTDANALASVGANVYQFKRTGQLSNSGRDKPTKSECREIVENTKGLAESLNFVSRSGAGRVASRTVLAFCHWAIKQRAGDDAANYYIDKLLSGHNLSKGCPILYARNRLIEIKSKMFLNEKAELIFRSYNLWCEGERDCKRIPVLGERLPKLLKPGFEIEAD